MNSSKDCVSVGLVGAGVQGYYQLLFTAKARNIKNIFVYDLYSQKLKRFKKQIAEQLPNINIKVCKDISELMTNSQIIITATNSNEPVLQNNKALLQGKHIIAIGSYKPNMRELPEKLFKLVDYVYVDTLFSIKESGDLIRPLEENWITKDQIKTFGKLITKSETINSSKTTLFKSVGMALMDLVVAEYIYKKALELGVGQDIKS